MLRVERMSTVGAGAAYYAASAHAASHGLMKRYEMPEGERLIIKSGVEKPLIGYGREIGNIICGVSPARRRVYR